MSDEIKQVIAAAIQEEPALTLVETRVLLAMALGHLEIYDIQHAYKPALQRARVEEALRSSTVHRAQCIIINYNNIYINNININILSNVVSTVQSAHRTPPMAFLDHLYARLDRESKPGKVELAAAPKAYQLAYRKTGSQPLALALMEDCLYYHGEFLQGVTQPMAYFIKVLDAYLASIPRKSKLVLEQEEITGKRQRFNPKTRKFEGVSKAKLWSQNTNRNSDK